MGKRISILELDIEELQSWCTRKKQPAFRGRQVFDWLYQKNVTDFEQMTNVPESLRQLLSKAYVGLCTEITEYCRDADGTAKYLFRLKDNHRIESVYLPRNTDYTLCISSQVGCALGCRFCATGTMGIVRNLSVGEILSQVIHIRQNDGLSSHGNIVFMGMGEPLLNLDAIIGAVERLTEPAALGWSPRRITVSTAGIVPEIRRLGERLPGINLAVSLNAADDRTRSRLMPINRKYPLKILMEALKAYPLPSRQHQITYEYIMLHRINDQMKDATHLIRLLDRRRDKINLIPFNPVPGSRFRCSEPESIRQFQKCLHDAGFTAMIRQSQGASIAAACGQLAGRPAPVPEE